MEVTLSHIVNMCADCKTMCKERTQRMVEDVGVQPWGFKNLQDKVFAGRRNEEQDKCVASCGAVAAQCPAAPKVHAYEAKSLAHAAKHIKDAETGSCQVFDDVVDGVGPHEMRHCETAVASFSQLLFTIAHKPVKIDFDDRDGDKPRDMLSGQKGDKAKGGADGKKPKEKRTLEEQSQRSVRPSISRYGMGNGMSPQQQQAVSNLQDSMFADLTPEQRAKFQELEDNSDGGSVRSHQRRL
jgi:hypothetical protein